MNCPAKENVIYFHIDVPALSWATVMVSQLSGLHLENATEFGIFGVSL